MEAGAGIEPANGGFADLGLTTWLPRHRYSLLERGDVTDIGAGVNRRASVCDHEWGGDDLHAGVAGKCAFGLFQGRDEIVFK